MPGHDVSPFAWLKLHKTLRRLALVTGGSFAFVTDISDRALCVALRSRGPRRGDVERAFEATHAFYAREIAPRLSEMRSGRRFCVEQADGVPRCVAKSFAGIYVAGIGSAGELDRDPVCAELQRALPGIEALTLELPPLGGPGGDEGAARLRQK